MKLKPSTVFREDFPARRFKAPGYLPGLILAAALLFVQAGLVSCVKSDASGFGPGAEHASAGAEGDGSGESGPGGARAPAGQGDKLAVAGEEKWLLVTDVRGDRDYSVFVDTNTIDTIEGEVMSWSKLVFEKDQKDSDGLVYREVKISSAINCDERTYQYMSSRFYDSLGRMVYNENIATDRSPIPGGTVSEYIANFVCGYEPPGPGTGSAPPPANNP